MSKGTPFSEEALLNKNFIKQPDGSYKKGTMLDKALNQAVQSPDLLPIPAGNKKIKNATKVIENGVTYDSKLEHYMAKCLQEAGIPYEFQKKYLLADGFRYRGEAYQPITLTVDFEIKMLDLIIDAKGFMNDVSPLKYKMLKKYLVEEGREPRIEMPNSQKSCRALIQSLQTGFTVDKPLSSGQVESRCKVLKKANATMVNELWILGDKTHYHDTLMNMQNWDFQQLISK